MCIETSSDDQFTYIQPLESDVNCHGLHFPFRYRWWFYYGICWRQMYILQHGWITAMPLQLIIHCKWQVAMLNGCIRSRCSLLHIDVEVRSVYMACVSKSKMSHSICTVNVKWYTHRLQFIQICVEIACQITEYYGRWQHFAGATSIIRYLIQNVYRACNYLCNYARMLQVTCSFQWI